MKTIDLPRLGNVPILLASAHIVAAICCGSAMAGTPASLALYDNQNYRSGSYLAYMAPWNRGRLIAGKDYTEKLTVLPSEFPSGTSIVWNWPNSPPPSGGGIYNFLAVDYGNYNGTIVERPIKPRKVVEIRTLLQKHDLVFSGALSRYDVITDLFLTSAAGDTEKKSFEVEIFLHTPAYTVSFVRSARKLGTFIDSGISWTVAMATGSIPNLLFMPDQMDVARGTVNLKSMLDYLISKRVLTGNEYFNGLGVGAEVRHSNGSLKIRLLSISYH